ncbi:unnamed protein product [Symbiodinium sp. CCMP2592]|nr:unnamed protein product [Symbiodinium sp. CCMP2592]
MHIILPKLNNTPQYAYLPHRSTYNAISRAARFCSTIRDRLAASRIEVQDRKQGKVRSTVTGGALISLDMSKAFDYVSHAYLAAAMRFLEIDEDTIQLVLAIHHTQYHVEHKGHTGQISLANGIRQGCVLSPMLWVIVTHYMFHQLTVKLTNFEPHASAAAWVRDYNTYFADDLLAKFELETVADLRLVCTRVGCLFEVLKAAGMQINDEKSRILLRASGNTLTKWIRKRSYVKDGIKYVQLGTPFAPVNIQLIKQLDYLGITLSFAQFECQTAKARIKQVLRDISHMRQPLIFTADVA